MGKAKFEDIVKKNPIRRTPRRAPVSEESIAPRSKWPEPEFYSREAGAGGRSRYMLWTVAFISIAFLLFALSFVFSKAKISVHPKIVETTLSDTFTASRTASEGSLVFDIVVISGDESLQVPATEEREVSDRAQGTVIIFNSFSAAPQKLAVDTRLAGSNGKIYKTKTPVTVPGMKGATPGSVEVGVYAAEAGDTYNSGPLDFQIVGFQGTPKYEKFKVRTKPGTAITGGFKGNTLVASAEEQAKAELEIRENLEAELYKKAESQIPRGFILWKDAAVFEPGNLEVSKGEEELTMTLEGTLYGLLFKEEEITRKIAEKKVKDYDGSPVFVPGLKELQFSLAPIGSVSLSEMNNISFNLSGSTKIIWKVDEEKFKTGLLGQPKKDFVAIVSQHENIDRAELSMIPVWKRVIPEEPEKVEIKINYGSIELSQ